jgi:hypothetical protein
VTRRRLFAGFVALLALFPSSAAATTAAALSDRISIDGDPGDFAADEWILDAASAFPERGDDSRWGVDNDVARVAVTWDRARLYLAVDFTASASAILVMIANGPGGVASLDAAGEFRRAIDPPFAANLLLLAGPGAPPRVARADAAHAFGLVDRATVPAVVVAAPDGRASFEASIPWTLLDVSRPVALVVAVTGGTGTGAGDAAPDPRTAPVTDRYARVVLDRWIVLDPDADTDGAADAGVAPRAAAVVEPDADPALETGDAEILVTRDRGVFAPDRGESVTFTLRTAAGTFDRIEGRCVILGVDGREVRAIAIPATGPAGEITVTWDGRDAGGRVCDGGVFVAAFDVEFSAAGGRRRASERTGVAVAR